MTLLRALPREAGDREVVHVFECRRCKVTFTTEDFLPITGRPLKDSTDP